ncbi:Peroxiredoxin family protein, partial [uncultured Gammaproteobacteria bacterium]
LATAKMTSLMVLNLQVQLLILMNVMAQTIIFIC